MIVLGIALCSESLWLKISIAAAPANRPQGKDILRAAGLLAFGITYVLILPYAGYFLSAAS